MDEAGKSDIRLEYQGPELAEYGSLAELTQGSGGSGGDFNDQSQFV